MRRSSGRVGRDAAEEPIIATPCKVQRPVCPRTFPKNSTGKSVSYSVSRITITNLGILPPIKRLRYFPGLTSTPTSCVTPYGLRIHLRTDYVIVTIISWGIPA
jgi:hypothetical protein